MHLATSWQLVVPVKHAERAKSRLLPPSGVGRADLARAIAADTLEVVVRALGAPEVIVVTADPVIGPWATELGAVVLDDPGTGLNAAIQRGLRQGAELGPHRPSAVLLGDLPALQTTDLIAALRAAGDHARALVPDQDGAGTVLLAGRGGAGSIRPLFGVGSARAHEEDGAVRLDLDLPRLRTDVDTAADLDAILRLGPGRRTGQLLSATG